MPASEIEIGPAEHPGRLPQLRAAAKKLIVTIRMMDGSGARGSHQEFSIASR